MKRAAVLGAIVMVSALPAAYAEAPTSAVEEPGIVRALVELNSTLLEIKSLLAQQVETQGLDLLLTRAEFASSRMIEIESHLQSAEANRRSVSAEKARIEANVEAWVANLEAGVTKATPEQEEAYLTRMDAAVVRLDKRLAELDRKIEELRNRLAGKERELREWQELLDRRLGET